MAIKKKPTASLVTILLGGTIFLGRVLFRLAALYVVIHFIVKFW
jgi:hypothetical protein